MSWRVVIVTRIPPVLAGFDAVVRDAGHEPVALLTMRDHDGRYGDSRHRRARESAAARPRRPHARAPRPRSRRCLPRSSPTSSSAWASRGRSRPMRSAVPRLGWLNGHPSLLPRHRGPLPVAWAIREGDEEIGITFHRMDAELDTGPILAQRRIPLGELQPPDTFYPELGRSSARRSPRRSSGSRRATRGRRRKRAAATRPSSPRKTSGSTSPARRPRCTGSPGPGAMRFGRRNARRAARARRQAGARARHLADRGRGRAAARVRRRAALGRRDGRAQRGRGQLVQRSGSIHAVTRRASLLWNGLP